MYRFNRRYWLFSLTAAFVTVAIAILGAIVTADNQSMPKIVKDLFTWEKIYIWAMLLGLVPLGVWLSLKSSQQSPEEQKKKQEYDFRKLLLKNVGAKIKESSRRQTLPKEIELRWELVRFDRRDEKIRGTSRKLPLPESAVIEQFLNLEIGTTMLILGDRGAGKSTMLHKLAQALLEPADQELDQAFKEHNTLNTSVPMPVVLHLPDWERHCRDKQMRSSSATFQAWVVSALDRQYRIKPEFGAPWIEVENLVLLLLLDGLDELHNRNESIKAIKQFRQEKRTTKIIICCQSQIYESLMMQDESFNTQLGIEQAFCAQTLEPDQIEEFLSQPGEKFEKIRAVYQAKQQPFRTPLDLSVIDAACREFTLQELLDIVQEKEWQPIFWGKYIQKMFDQRGMILASGKRLYIGCNG